MNKILEFFNELPVKKKIIYLIILMLILLILTIQMIKLKDSNTYTSNLNYRNLKVEELLQNYTENYANRDTYLVLKNIVNTLKREYSESPKALKEYYSVLDKKYSSKISKNKFLDKINSLFQRAYSLGNDYDLKMYCENSNENTYIVELFDGETIGYIGIILTPQNTTYSIFYIE